MSHMGLWQVVEQEVTIKQKVLRHPCVSIMEILLAKSVLA